MGSPLGPVLDNIFAGYNKNKLFDFSVKPQLYKRYVDDIFALLFTDSVDDWNSSLCGMPARELLLID